MDWFRSLSSQAMIAVCVIGLFLAGIVGDVVEHSDWHKHREEVQRQEVQRERLRSVGTDATVTAAFLFSAVKQCSVIGVPEIDSCAKQTGPLVQEEVAASVAGEALGQRNAYYTDCESSYAKDYCVALLTRAFAIAKNSASANSIGGE